MREKKPGPHISHMLFKQLDMQMRQTRWLRYRFAIVLVDARIV